jgi:hypothetical protein
MKVADVAGVGVGLGVGEEPGVGVGVGFGELAPTPPQPMALKTRMRVQHSRMLRRLAFTGYGPLLADGSAIVIALETRGVLLPDKNQLLCRRLCGCRD